MALDAVAGKLSKSADVYAFGVLLWEMYTGQRPWSGLGQMQIIFHLTQRKKRLQFPSETPPQLQVCGQVNRLGFCQYVCGCMHVACEDDSCICAYTALNIGELHVVECMFCCTWWHTTVEFAQHVKCVLSCTDHSLCKSTHWVNCATEYVNCCVHNLQALGTRCMSAEATERPKFDEILHLVDDLNVNVLT